MASTKFLINKDVSVPESFTRIVEADHYRIADGYFHFYSDKGSAASKVFSIDASKVFVVEIAEESDEN